ncbi:MAG: hypothetical protein JRI79_06765 [Deltaproteobacteria bacterium]|nr:hypothetical protein [Deltaproteobacteria bacterium]MBW1919265.1 hypothetical protein [Deltaproteobacteria bacterium]MBW1935086.1 hypothetical protein [Deltaproteobacteria bacterium]MBW1977654.1 hypothetical protein [Deltaproteobacteria bacterium]MBW2044972.1 hypothetical protein [Deltaproteobacteria bacterium]
MDLKEILCGILEGYAYAERRGQDEKEQVVIVAQKLGSTAEFSWSTRKGQIRRN